MLNYELKRYGDIFIQPLFLLNNLYAYRSNTTVDEILALAATASVPENSL